MPSNEKRGANRRRGKKSWKPSGWKGSAREQANKLHSVKVKAAGGQDAWKVQLQEQRAEAAEEARSKQTAGGR